MRVTDDGTPPLSTSESIQVNVASTPTPTPTPAPTTPASPAATDLTLSSSVASPLAGQSVTFTAGVTSADGVDTPAGTLTFLDRGKPLGSAALVNGQARFTTAAMTAGPHTITAVYAGSDAFLGANSTLSLTVTTMARRADPRHRGKFIVAIAGTPEADVFRVTAIKGGSIIRIEIRSGKHAHSIRTFPARNVARILILGSPRRDRLQVNPDVKIPVAFAASFPGR